ncbi:MAG: alanine--tRNA ligase [Paracoccaceae bacterium]|nr:alanine--tRNA ligase [Paracoccaceae bacterium]
MPSLNEIRSSFLSYFKNQGHSIQPSSPLVPRNDPTLMFVNSGMVQFKNLFTGIETRDYKCAATAQKCVRAGGKHNDLDNVGYTARHHTFFEMLGNFSFGDYFKNDAIPFAWEFITKELGIPKEKLVVTVYHDDEETISIWKKVSGLPDSSIIRISTDDNFWMMGATGPCGPCSEIFYDHGEGIWGGPPGSPEEDGDRFVEIWNLVFMQYEQLKDGTRINLPNQSIDTGLGLERVTALLQGTNDNYATDLMRNLIETSANLSNTEPDGSAKIHHRVISDHLRSTSFLIADGVLPSKDGRGYVLRRIMRRAMRHAHMLGTAEPLMYKLVPALVKEMGEAYPELYAAQDLIEETLRSEEARFKETLDRGLKLLDDEVLKIEEGTNLSGDTAFKLYDTFGFPLDLTQDALREKGLKVDVDAFNRAMTSQKEKARASWTGSGETTDAAIWFNISQEFGSTEFLGYGTEESEAKVLAIVCEGKEVSNAKAGTSVQIVFNQSPFYAESGGQIGDSGQVELDGSVTQIEDVRLVASVFVHFVDGLKFNLSVGDEVKLIVSSEKRSAIRSNHSATHLLNESLRKSLGNTVSQRGSLNSDDRLRFDFNHNKALSSEQINTIEKEVNMYIRQNSLVETRVMTPDEARDLGAQALFGEKYGEEVRVVSMGHAGTGKGVDGQTYSIELCGGTHVKRTGDIGLFLIVGESASSSGVRRIEAITGSTAVNYVRGRSNQLSLVEGLLKSKPEDLSTRLQSLLNERKTLTNQVNDLRTAIATNEDNSNENIEKINGITFITKVTNGIESKNFPSIIDNYKSSIEMGIILLIGESSGKVSVAVGVTNDLLTKYSAVELVKIAVSQLGGKGGGGRPDLAQGGAKEITGSENAINAVKKMIGV